MPAEHVGKPGQEVLEDVSADDDLGAHFTVVLRDLSAHNGVCRCRNQVILVLRNSSACGFYPSLFQQFDNFPKEVVAKF